MTSSHLKEKFCILLLIGEISLRKHEFKTFLIMCLTIRPTTMLGRNLNKSIIMIRQDFVGNYNINLLLPMNQFGTKYNWGKDHTTSHYINTKVSIIAVFIFLIDDYKMIFSYLKEYEKLVEPKFYLSIILMALVNRCRDVWTSFSTFIPCFSYVDIFKNLRSFIRGEEEMRLVQMIPWYIGYSELLSKIQHPNLLQEYYHAIKKTAKKEKDENTKINKKTDLLMIIFNRSRLY